MFQPGDVKQLERTGIPYVCKVARMLAIHIFNKLVASHTYDSQGQRIDQNKDLDDELLNNVEHAKVITRYMARSSKKTEYHKSTKEARNSKDDPNHKCNHCDRKFLDDINLTLHAYWHTCQDNKAIARSRGQDVPDYLEEEDKSDEDPNTTDAVFRFKASHGWLKNFKIRQNVAFLKLKGEKGSADYEAVEDWVDEWITRFYQLYLKEYPKTFRQAVFLVVNFDESGFQYKSIPQYSLVMRGTEIRAKKKL